MSIIATDSKGRSPSHALFLNKKVAKSVSVATVLALFAGHGDFDGQCTVKLEDEYSSLPIYYVVKDGAASEVIAMLIETQPESACIPNAKMLWTEKNLISSKLFFIMVAICYHRLLSLCSQWSSGSKVTNQTLLNDTIENVNPKIVHSSNIICHWPIKSQRLSLHAYMNSAVEVTRLLRAFHVSLFPFLGVSN